MLNPGAGSTIIKSKLTYCGRKCITIRGVIDRAIDYLFGDELTNRNGCRISIDRTMIDTVERTNVLSTNRPIG